MTFLHRIAAGLAAVAVFLTLPLRAAPTNESIAKATAAMEAAIPRAQADPMHPIFHVTSPAQWMNDPNGPVFYKDYFHLFYQLNPYSDGSGPKYWGHVRSRDLVKWERLPIALWPSSEKGEAEIWSGCCTINGLGVPMAFYTSIAAGSNPGNHAEQWAAISDDDMMTWHKSADNPVLSEALNGHRKVYDWRDPFIFHYQKLTYLVAGGNLNQAHGGEGVVNIYQALNPELTKWKYRGILFHLPKDAPTAECPNFFPLGDHFVLFVSPYGKVQYFVGDFDTYHCEFHPRTNGWADYGPNFYAPNTMLVPDGRRITWGWVTGFPEGRGWNGSLSLPRELSIGDDFRLRQTPAPQLAKLRGAPMERSDVLFADSGVIMELPPTNAFEISTSIDFDNAEKMELTLKGQGAGAPIVFTVTPDEFTMPDTRAPLSFHGTHRHIDLRIFLDHSVLEVFVNKTICATKVIAPIEGTPTLRFCAPDGYAVASDVSVWPMKSIW